MVQSRANILRVVRQYDVAGCIIGTCRCNPTIAEIAPLSLAPCKVPKAILLRRGHGAFAALPPSGRRGRSGTGAGTATGLPSSTRRNPVQAVLFVFENP